MAASAVVGALRANLGMNSVQFRRGTSEAQRSLQQLRSQFRLVAAGGAALGATLTASVVAGLRDVDRQAKAARSIDGTTSGLRALEIAAGDAGVEVGLVTTGMQKMGRELARAAAEAGPAREALNSVGLSADRLLSLDADERVAALADRTRELGFSAAQTANLLRDLGVGQAEFAKLVAAGGDSIRAARNEVRLMGLELDAAGVAKVEAANDSLSRLGLGFESFRNQLAIAVAPALLDLSNAFAASLREGGALNTMIDALGKNVGTLVSVAGTGVAVFGTRYVLAFAGMRVATDGVTFSLVKFRAAMITTGVGALAVGLGILIAHMTGLDGAAARAQLAIDNVTLAMADEIRQVQQLTAAMAPGTVMTIEAAERKLEQAEATLAHVDAMRQEQIELFKSTDAYRDVARQVSDATARLDNFRESSAANQFGENAEITRRIMSALEADLARALEAQERLLEEATGITPEYAAAAAEVERVKTAIAAAKDGMVRFSGQVVSAVDLSRRLAGTIGQIDFTPSVRSAQQLAQQLNVSLHRAMQIMGLIGEAAQSRNAEVVFDPRDPRYDAEAAQQAARMERLRAQMEKIREETETVPLISTSVAELSNSAGSAARALDKVEEESAELGETLDSPLKSSIDQVRDAFKDFAERGFKDFKSFADSVKATFKKLLRDMIIAAAKNKIVIGLGLDKLGGVAGSALSSGGSAIMSGGLSAGIAGLGTFASSIGTGLSVVGNGFMAGGLGGAATATAGAISGGIGAGGAVGLGTALGAALPAIGAVVVAGALLKKLFGKKKSIISTKDFNTITKGLALTNQSLWNAGDRGDQKKVAANLKKMAGGAKEFTEQTQNYFAKFFTATEQRAEAVKNLTASFDKMGVAMPKTAGEFRDLVEGLDLSTSSGQQTYAQLLKVSDAFAAVYGTAQDATAALAGFYSGNVFSSLTEERLAAAALARGASFSTQQSYGGVISPRDLVRLSETDPNGVETVVALRDLLRIFRRWDMYGMPAEAS